jgi:acrylyl-CoA reductase (NADPH)
LETDLDRQKLATMTREIGLSDIFGVAPEILSGRVRGRVVVKVG